jgi:adhesin transport system membrane fusion protein
MSYADQHKSWPMISILSAGFAALAFWASQSDLDQLVRATGQVIPDARTQIIQAADGGVLFELRVQEGQAVKAGQILAVLEKERAQAGFKEIVARVASLRAILDRTNAEISQKPLLFNKQSAAFPEFTTAQAGLYMQRKKTLDEEMGYLQEALANAKEELEMNQKLMKTGDTSRLDLLRSERQVTDLAGRISATRNRYLQEARQDASKAEEELATTQQKLNERQSILNHTDLTSPVGGVVKYLRVNTIGGVLRPGDELMQIAPTDGGFFVEGRVTPSDVGSLKLGLPVTVRVDSFDYSIYGTLKGQLTHISPDTLSEQGSRGETNVFYRIQVRLDADQSHNPRAQDIVIKSGMTTSLDIRTGERTVMQYLIKPIFKAFQGAMTER